MRLMALEKISKDEKLAKAVIKNDGQIVLGKGVNVTIKYAQRLLHMGYTHVYIEDKLMEGVDVSDVVSDETKMEILGKVDKTFKNLIDYKDSKVYQMDLGKEFKSTIDHMLAEMKSNKVVLVNMMNIRSKDDYLQFHSMNVGVLTLAMAFNHGMRNDELQQLALGSILHDVGKTKVPNEVLFKKGKLTDEEWVEMKKHSMHGFEILKEQPGISLRSAHVALQHHEKFNGDGYPRELVSKDIHLFGRITALADVYDALTSNRVYKKACLPHEAFELLLGNGDVHFDLELVNLFKKTVAIYPIGTTVKLSDGRDGIVIKVYQGYPQRPVVRLLDGSEDVDLSCKTKQTILITEVL